MQPAEITGTLIYRFLKMERSELADSPYLLNDIYKKNKDGLLIKNVLTQSQVDQILHHYHQDINREEVMVVGEVETYPRGFADYYENAQTGDMSTYYSSSAKYNAAFPEQFGVDIQGIVREVLQQLSGGRKVSAPVSPDGQGAFLFAQFRNLYPAGRALPLHCENVFRHMYGHFYQDLVKSTSIDLDDQMSYFLVLQTSDLGGELTLYDILWEEGQQMIPFDAMRQADGSTVNITDPALKRLVVNPQPGDMIIFRGGEIWHKVEAIRGQKGRMTLGGFLAYSNSSDEIHIWA